MFNTPFGRGRSIYRSPRVERPLVRRHDVSLLPHDVFDPPKDRFQTPRVLDGVAAALGTPAMIGVLADIMTNGNVLTTPLEANTAVGAIALSVSIKASAEAGVWIANRSRAIAQHVGRRVAFALHGDPAGGPIENGVQTTRSTFDDEASRFVNAPYSETQLSEVNQLVEPYPIPHSFPEV